MAEISSLTGAAQQIAASALRAQQARMRVIAENIANADSVSKTAGGDPYRRQVPVFSPTTIAGGAAKGVKMSRVVSDQSDFTTEYVHINASYRT